MIKLSIDITSNNGSEYFNISGEIQDIRNNKRILISLKRLGYIDKEESILIPFRLEDQISTLQEIQDLFQKYDFEFDYSRNIEDDIQNFHREELNFENFSLKAYSIRNDEFKKHPELVSEFDNFQKILQEELKRTLYPLQLLSAFHLAFSQNACNFAVPGAGKTSIVYGAYAYLKSLPKNDPKHVDRLIVIGPISSFAPWENEYAECFGKKINSQRLSGDINISKKEKLEYFYSSNPAEVGLIFHGGVSSFQNEIIDFLKKHKTMVVVDEAHRIKNPNRIWGSSVTEISKEATARVILTGTPLPNGYEDIYNLYKFIYPFKYKEILGYHYQNLQDLTLNNEPDSDRVNILKENISPFFIRIKKKDLNLPKINEKIVYVDMESYQQEIYNFIEDEYLPSLRNNPSGSVKDVLNRAKLIRLRQASTNPSLLAKTLKNSLEQGNEEWDADPNIQFLTLSDEFIDDSEFFNKICNYSKFEIPVKFTEIFKIIKNEIFPKNGKVIIWTIFIQNAKELQSFLIKNEIKSKLLIGEIPQEERETTIKLFNDSTNFDFSVIIANPFSVAESISLHKGCHNAIYLERDYNASNFIQSKDRIHRVGLPENTITNYYYIVSKNSIDTVINNRLNEKVKRMEKIIDDEIPLFSRIDNNDETDIIVDLLKNYAERSKKI
ncbi:DEAD/DEAH box helicase family protein [Flavobacterium sp. IMCC34852]|uniref:DEAD/DEAH box helicase family protein n=1 Tax=Flavobacterium rivulicola TaxID=2732161 RepID=A0A7Y3VXT1_9FLAO|nr:SNF2-related protein [Flavobacterium sp. IMCC34852]NNT70923.1 DEAD/DEAH box helicase family protein [Flavobacterium sp. IMCC34852]